jgi:hypothetical protein
LALKKPKPLRRTSSFKWHAVDNDGLSDIQHYWPNLKSQSSLYKILLQNRFDWIYIHTRIAGIYSVGRLK